MKNIHVLPTDKPSRLFEIIQFNLSFDKTNYFSEDYKILHKYKNKHIYITSDEEIKLNDYVIQINFEKTNTQIIQCVDEFQVRIANDKDGSFTKKKIILTTDQDLIKDGVQAIDDEFLEWFVKNSSCESVEVLEAPKLIKMIDNEFYKIIIPKEEPKQETLEEIANKIYHNTKHSYPVIPNYTNWIQGFVEGTKYQQERMYSEEEVLDILIKLNDSPFEFDFDSEVEEWFEQFKKK